MLRQKGFTLIEILVVIAIIGVLISLSLASYASARRSARDARRLGDIKNIMTALERYYNDNRSYPLRDGSCTTNDGTWCCSGSGGGKSNWIPGLGTYMDNGVPKQLGNLQGHCYNDGDTGQSYLIDYSLERYPNPDAMGTTLYTAQPERYQVRGGI